MSKNNLSRKKYNNENDCIYCKSSNLVKKQIGKFDCLFCNDCFEIQQYENKNTTVKKSKKSKSPKPTKEKIKINRGKLNIELIPKQMRLWQEK